MLKKCLYVFAFLSATELTAQSSTQAQVIGGKEQLDQVMQTQLTLSKALLNSNFDADVNVSFDLDSAGYATKITFNSGLNNILRNETIRFLRFLRFTQIQYDHPYSFSYHISTEQYYKFMKQRSRFSLKKPMPADSSFVIYTRADKSPEYYKNGDEGLAEYMLSEIEYPKLAIEKSVEGTVVVEFVVETNGYVTGITLKQPLGAGCSEEALRLIKSTKWQPAVLNNKLVRYKTTYPITFSLRNVTRDASSTIGQ